MNLNEPPVHLTHRARYILIIVIMESTDTPVLEALSASVEIAQGSEPPASAGVKSLFSKTKKKIKTANVSTLPPPPPPPPVRDDAVSSSNTDEGWEREYQKLDTYLKEHGLSIVKVDADGSCLFSSFALHFPETTTEDLRREAVLYMLSHADDFEPFIDLEMYPNGFCDYCMRMGRNTTWGGQLEIQALSQSRKVNVYVFQTGGLSTIKMVNFDTATAQCVTVSYHDGQHYNCVLPIEKESIQLLTCDSLESWLSNKDSEESSPPPASYTDSSVSKLRAGKKKSLFN